MLWVKGLGYPIAGSLDPHGQLEFKVTAEHLVRDRVAIFRI